MNFFSNQGILSFNKALPLPWILLTLISFSSLSLYLRPKIGTVRLPFIPLLLHRRPQNLSLSLFSSRPSALQVGKRGPVSGRNGEHLDPFQSLGHSPEGRSYNISWEGKVGTRASPLKHASDICLLPKAQSFNFPGNQRLRGRGKAFK